MALLDAIDGPFHAGRGQSLWQGQHAEYAEHAEPQPSSQSALP